MCTVHVMLAFFLLLKKPFLLTSAILDGLLLLILILSSSICGNAFDFWVSVNWADASWRRGPTWAGRPWRWTLCRWRPPATWAGARSSGSVAAATGPKSYWATQAARPCSVAGTASTLASWRSWNGRCVRSSRPPSSACGRRCWLPGHRPRGPTRTLWIRASTGRTCLK